MTETSIPIGGIAAHLGYSEQSSLTRACRDWFDVSPLALRRQARRVTIGSRPTPP
ncbi:MAG: AraC family transcriptional regulator [Acidobacteria bacterium]|nr:MAG: AraC family transcriptional regulator [Acidobacteriota bacterium]MCL4286633.1 hypothetical protein [Thermoleophilia bacterium]